MSPVASAAVVSGDPDRRMVIFRIIEFLFVFPYIITISYTTGHLGWWFYSDMEAAVILGCESISLNWWQKLTYSNQLPRADALSS